MNTKDKIIVINVIDKKIIISDNVTVLELQEVQRLGLLLKNFELEIVSMEEGKDGEVADIPMPKVEDEPNPYDMEPDPYPEVELEEERKLFVEKWMQELEDLEERRREAFKKKLESTGMRNLL